MKSLVARVVVLAPLAVPPVLHGQQGVPARIEVEPAALVLNVGDTVTLAAVVYDTADEAIPEAQVFFFSRGRHLAVDRDGKVHALRGGQHTVFVFARTPSGAARGEVPITVPFPPVARVQITPTSNQFFVGGSQRHEAIVTDLSGTVRRDITIVWSSSDPAVATVDEFGVVTGLRSGVATIRAEADGVLAQHIYRVVPSPVRQVALTASTSSATTGDLIHFTARALDDQGREVPEAPILLSVVSMPEDSVVAQFPAAEVDQRGRFVAYKAGLHTVIAMSAGQVAHHSILVTPRHVSSKIDVVGQGAVRDVRTSDLWVWEGVDGRDYAVTGTWNAAGAAYFWDVSDPSNPVMVDSVVVDARTVNDVKVSEDGRVCVITREGASNRRNGIVLLDCANPRDVTVLSTFDDGLTGGVHNVFVYQNHVYAVNNGRRFDVINIADPRNPRRVGMFELDTPGHAIHDVWVVDGIAYTSNWSDGVVLVDVGNGIAGGSPSNPVRVAQYRDVGGATHAALPFRSSSGKFYVIMGDEAGRDADGPMGREGEQGGTPDAMSGYLHFVDFSDPLHPEEVARYEVPEAGSHNIWVTGDTLYAAFYNGGVRVVDISGELKGNLTYQGREIARFKAYDPTGFVPNAPMSWGPQPFKGHLFIAEHYSGLWAVKVRETEILTP